MQLIKKLKDKLQGKVPRGTRRSSRWPAVRKEHLKKQPACAVCGNKTKVEAHHIQPFHLRPDLELEPSNLISLCESGKYGIKSCHQVWGHLGNWKRMNPDVIEDAKIWNKRLIGKWEDLEQTLPEKNLAS